MIERQPGNYTIIIEVSCSCFTCRNWWDLALAVGVVARPSWAEVLLVALDVWLDVHLVLEGVVLHQSFETFIETQVQINVWLNLDGGPVVS